MIQPALGKADHRVPAGQRCEQYLLYGAQGRITLINDTNRTLTFSVAIPDADKETIHIDKTTRVHIDWDKKTAVRCTGPQETCQGWPA